MSGPLEMGRTRGPLPAVPLAILGLGGLAFAATGGGPNTGLAVQALLVLALGCWLLWRPGEAPVLLLGFLNAWLGASLPVFHANWLGVGLGSYSPLVSELGNAIALSLAGLAALAIGLRAGAGPVSPDLTAGLRSLAMSRPVGTWFRLYLSGFGLTLVGGAAVAAAPGLSQVALGVSNLKWAFYFMLAFASIVRPGGRLGYLAGAFLLELALSLGGFFADFQMVFYVTIAAALGARPRLSPAALGGVAVLGIVLVLLGVVWTTVKSDYREYVSAGRSDQVIRVDYMERLGKLAQLAGELDQAKLSAGIDRLLRRRGYVEYFGAALNYVPAYAEHTEGSIMLDALVRPLMPRILFPDKAVIDDTQRTNQFTGGLAGTSEGTSISLGYIAETYIDFGLLGMHVALCAIGFSYGTIYRRLLHSRSLPPVFGMGLAASILLTCMAIENSFTKVFGGLVATLLVAWILNATVIPLWAPWLRAGRRAAIRQSNPVGPGGGKRLRIPS